MHDLTLEYYGAVLLAEYAFEEYSRHHPHYFQLQLPSASLSVAEHSFRNSQVSLAHV